MDKRPTKPTAPITKDMDAAVPSTSTDVSAVQPKRKIVRKRSVRQARMSAASFATDSSSSDEEEPPVRRASEPKLTISRKRACPATETSVGEPSQKRIAKRETTPEETSEHSEVSSSDIESEETDEKPAENAPDNENGTETTFTSSEEEYSSGEEFKPWSRGTPKKRRSTTQRVLKKIEQPKEEPWPLNWKCTRMTRSMAARRDALMNEWFGDDVEDSDLEDIFEQHSTMQNEERVGVAAENSIASSSGTLSRKPWVPVTVGSAKRKRTQPLKLDRDQVFRIKPEDIPYPTRESALITNIRHLVQNRATLEELNIISSVFIYRHLHPCDCSFHRNE